MASSQELLDNLRAQYPQYDDMEDADLAKSVYEKYPKEYPELLETAIPARAKEYGEIKATPDITQQFGTDIKEGLRNLISGPGVLPRIAGAGQAISAPFKALGTAAERVSANVLPEWLQDRRGYDLPGRIGSATEFWSILGSGVGAPAKMAERAAAKLTPEAIPLGAGPAAEFAATQAVKRPLALPPGPKKPLNIMDIPPIKGPPKPIEPVAPTTLDLALRRAGITPKILGPRGEAVGTVGAKVPRYDPENLIPGGGQGGYVTPQTLGLMARTIGGAAAGQTQGETLEEKLRWGTAGAIVAAISSPRLIKTGFQAGKSALQQSKIGPETIEKISESKILAGGNNRLFGFTPSDIARGDPSASALVRQGFIAKEIERSVQHKLLTEAHTIYGAAAGDAKLVTKVHQILDGKAAATTPAEMELATKLRSYFDRLAALANLPVERRLVDYFPHVRDVLGDLLEFKIATKRKLNIGVPGSKTPVLKNVRSEYTPFFAKPRTLKTDAPDYGMDPINLYIQGVSRKISLSGGIHPDSGTAVEGFLNKAKPYLDALPENSVIRQYWGTYVNDLAGQPRGGSRLLSPEAINQVKQFEFLRTIGSNVMSPVNNLMQQLNTLAYVDTRSHFLAYWDLLHNPQILKIAKQAHVTTDLSKVDIETLATSTKLGKLLDTGTKYGGYLFQKSEQLNRLHAFAAGYRDATRQGLKGINAVNYAKQIVDATQFRFGIENLPQGMRAQGAGRIFSQFKPYQLNQMQFLKNMFVDDLRSVTSGKLPTRLGKWLTGATLVAGPTAVLGESAGEWVKQTFSQLLTGDPKTIDFDGLASGMGIWLAEQVGIGALPMENIRSIAFMLPGPFISHVLDVASVASGRKLALTDVVAGRAGEQLTPEEFARRATTSINIQLDRFRRGANIAATPGPMIREPYSGEEALGFGTTPMTGQALRRKEPGAAVRTMLGARTPQSAKAAQSSQKIREAKETWNRLVRQKADAMIRGDHDGIKRANVEGRKLLGRIPTISPQALDGARERKANPRQARQLESVPSKIRPGLRRETR